MIKRRQLVLAAAAAAPAVLISRAFAQSYPVRPVRVIVGFTAGSAADITTRLIAERLSEQLRQPFVVDNRPGVASNLAIQTLVGAPADGYTVGLVNIGNAIGATLYEKLRFDVNRDITPIAGFVRGVSVMAVSPSFPVHTVPQFIRYAKANPGKLNMASGGNGTLQHVAGELFKAMANVDMVHVAYSGTPAALTDLFAGRAHVIFDNLASSMEHIRAGRLRALAVTTATRTPALPDVPPVADFVRGFEASAWSGLAGPKGMPSGVIDTINAATNSILVESTVRERLASLGATALLGTPAEFGKLIVDETARWSVVVRSAAAQRS